jgi:hypothetical protein
MDAEKAIDPADEAADHAADQTPNRSRGLTTYVSAMRDAVGHSLRLRRERASDGRSNETCE